MHTAIKEDEQRIGVELGEYGADAAVVSAVWDGNVQNKEEGRGKGWDNVSSCCAEE